MTARVPKFPESDSEYLNSLLHILKSRSKAIKHFASDWEIHQSFEKGEEQIDVVIKNWDRSVSRLIAWSSDENWFCYSKPNPKTIGGWESNFAFHLVIAHEQINQAVATFEKACLISDEKSNLKIWQEFSPIVDPAVRK